MAQQGNVNQDIFDEIKQISKKKADICKDIEEKTKNSNYIIDFYNKVQSSKNNLIDSKNYLLNKQNENSIDSTKKTLSK